MLIMYWSSDVCSSDLFALCLLRTANECLCLPRMLVCQQQMLRAQLPQQGQLGAGTRTDNQRDSPLIRPVFNQLFEQRAHIGHGCQLCEKGSFAATTTNAKRRTDTTHHYLNGYFSEVTLPGRSSTQELQAITPEPVRQAVGGGRGGNQRGIRHLEYPPPCHSPSRNHSPFTTPLRPT